MALATTKQWSVTKTDPNFNGLELKEAPAAILGDNDVLVRIHAVALNFRDLMIARGDYPFPLKLPVTPCSDGAGEIVDIGSKVTRWAKGDKVITLLSQAHLYGPANAETANSGLGGSLNGTLGQYSVLNEQGLVRCPRNLSYREACTLTCAGVTSWNALYGLKPLQSGQTVLVLGTGGVSLFALQFAKAAGATVIATTSSDDKAKTLRGLGADHVVNYKTDLAWGETVKSLTVNSQGVDQIVEVGGPGTLHQSVKAIKNEGLISVVGAVSPGEATSLPSILDCWLNNFVARGVAVGSRVQMEDMVAAIEANDIHPVVDKKHFSLHEAIEAFHYYSSQKNLGKIVITVN